MNESHLTDHAADYLHSEAHQLVARWIEWVRTRLGTSTVENLPYKAIENHIPPVLHSLADYVRNPIEAIGSELVGHLRMHGQIRRDQGYTSTEVIGEFDGLSSIIINAVRERFEDGIADAGGEDAAALFIRLSTGLRMIHAIVLDTYNETDSQKNRAVSRRLEQLATSIAHDLKNPLGAIRLGLKAVRHELGEHESLERSLTNIENEVERTLAMLNTLKMLAITESAWAGDRLVLIAEALSNLLGEFADLAHQHDVTVQVEGTIPAVKAEAILVFLVLSNVLTNAIKYADADKDERTITVTGELIERANDTGFVEIVVRDNGIGIPADLLSFVTQRGFRAHPEQSYGTGMGLYLVQTTLEERSGEFEIQSQEGEWTEVRVRFRCISEQTESLLPEKIDTVRLIQQNAMSTDGDADEDEQEGDGGEDA